MTIVELTKAVRAKTGNNIGTTVVNGQWAVAKYSKVAGSKVLHKELLTPFGTMQQAAAYLSSML